MRRDSSFIWRGLFLVGGFLYFAGSFNHPRDMTMAEMLVNPAWIPAHAAVFIGFLLLTMGLVAYRRVVSIPPAMDRWLRFTLVLAVFQVIEMALHTLAYVDAEGVSGTAFHAGMATPVLTAHLWLSTLAFTPFAAALIGLIGIGQRERLLGSPWIGWLGMLAAVAYGSVMWLVFIFEVDGTGVLFPIAHLGVSLWFMLAGVWPIRPYAGSAAAA